MHPQVTLSAPEERGAHHGEGDLSPRSRPWILGGGASSGGTESIMDRLLALMAKLPTTQGQAVISWLLWLSTGSRYLASNHWVPSYEWLGALLLLSGVSTAQFVAKRTPDHTYVAVKQGTAPPPTDV